jgi:Ca2+-binding RTX toxin-like protein
MSAPTAHEQFMLELVNAERIAAGVQPLAFNFQLNDSAELHSRWMIANDTFSHTGANGSAPTDRMAAAGYQLSGAWTTGENIAWASTRAPAGLQDEVQLLHTNLMNSPGHRANILNGNFREVGVGFEVGEYQGWDGAFVTQNFARSGSAFFITGVAFDDRDGDLFYDPGEGLAGVTVTVLPAGGEAWGAVAAYASGGYAAAVSPGTYTVTFSGAGFAASSRTVTVGSANVKLDWVDPAAAGGGSTPGDDNLTGSSLDGGAGNDTLNGTANADYLRGGEGHDLIFGAAAFDDMHGGAGNDTLQANQGDDWVVGGQGDDFLYGGQGSDMVVGGLGNDILLANMGDDVADGGEGADQLRGGQGSDSLSGGAGNDWLAGDREADTIAGGAGADTFHTWGGAGLDRVTDFSYAEGDRVNLLAGTAYTAAQSGADVVVAMGGGGQMVLANVSMTTLGPGWIFES